MKKLNDLFKEEYDFLYANADSYVAGSNEALNYFDNELTAEEKEILKEFIEYRGDFISSDREAIAFIFALERRF